MLGENHSLLSEFPEFKEHIERLIESDQAFAVKAKKYDDLDAQIRQLELANSPASDATMHQMKHDRAELKDSLYKQLSTV